MKKILKIVSSGSPYGSERVVNGTFDTDSDWTKVNSTISGGTGNLNGTGVTSLLFQDVFTNGQTFKVEFDVTNHNATGESKIVNNNGTDIFTITGNGHYNFEYTHNIASGNMLFRARFNNIYSVDNVSVKQKL